MKKFLLFTLMLLVFNYSYSVSKIMPENDWKKMNLKGRVMKMVKKVHKYNTDGKSLGEEEITFIFNSQGYITTEIHKGAFSLSYEHDENGYLIEVQMFMEQNMSMNMRMMKMAIQFKQIEKEKKEALQI